MMTRAADRSARRAWGGGPDVSAESNHNRAGEFEHFQAKWIPVRVKKMLQNKDLERCADPVGSENALAPKQLGELHSSVLAVLVTAIQHGKR
jgi:hypothetical protein